VLLATQVFRFQTPVRVAAATMAAAARCNPLRSRVRQKVGRDVQPVRYDVGRDHNGLRARLAEFQYSARRPGAGQTVDHRLPAIASGGMFSAEHTVKPVFRCLA
jgi:hypothetical protein